MTRSNPKHIDVRLHLIRELAREGYITVYHVPFKVYPNRSRVRRCIRYTPNISYILLLAAKLFGFESDLMQEVGVLWCDTRFGTVDDEKFQLGDYIYKKSGYFI